MKIRINTKAAVFAQLCAFIEDKSSPLHVSTQNREEDGLRHYQACAVAILRCTGKDHKELELDIEVAERYHESLFPGIQKNDTWADRDKLIPRSVMDALMYILRIFPISS